MQQIYKRAPMPKCDFIKVALQHYWNHSSEGVFSCKFAACFQNTFSKDHLWVAISEVSKLLAQLIKTITEKFLIKEEPERLHHTNVISKFSLNSKWDLILKYLHANVLREDQKQPSRGVHWKRYSENMQQICRRTLTPKCDFNKVAKQNLLKLHFSMRVLL